MDAHNVLNKLSGTTGRVYGCGKNVQGKCLHGRWLSHTCARNFVQKPVVVLVVLFCSLVTSATATAFQLQSLDAQRVNLNDYVGGGQWTLVMFWSNDCVPCEQQKPMLEAFHRDHDGKDARVIGIALDGMEQFAGIKEIMERHDPSYPNLVVFTDVFHRQFKELTGKEFRVTPTYLLYAPDGSLAGTRAGPLERELLESIVAGK